MIILINILLMAPAALFSLDENSPQIEPRSRSVACKEAFLSGIVVGFCEKITQSTGGSVFDENVAVFHQAMRFASLGFWLFERSYEGEARAIPSVFIANILGYGVGLLGGEIIKPYMPRRRVKIFERAPQVTGQKSP